MKKKYINALRMSIASLTGILEGPKLLSVASQTVLLHIHGSRGSHIFLQIDHEVISRVILTPSAAQLSPSYTVTIQAPIQHDSSRFETDGKIGLHRDASGWKKRDSSINTMSHDAPTVSARFIYGPTTTHDGSATIHHRGATNAHECS